MVIGRLSSFDLPGRLKCLAPAPVVQIVVGGALAALAFGMRWMIALVIPDVARFMLLFPAILLATGLAGWQAGFITLLVGGLFSWPLLTPTDSWLLGPTAAASMSLYVLSGALVIAAAAAYRTTALALRESQERLDLATAAAQVGVWEWRPQTGEMFCSDEAKRIYGFGANELVTYDMVRAATHPEDAHVGYLAAARAAAPEPRDHRPHEYRIVRAGGEVRWIHAMGRAVFEPGKDGVAPTRFVGAVQDVSARKAAEERMRLLAREVDHRANNLLAVVQGTVALSQADDASTLKRVITGRVNALARAHQLLANARWEGADLRRLVEEELLPFSLGDEGRVALQGPSVALAPAAAQSVAMALHELATNAAKYGALSAPEGRVEVRWSRDAAGELRLTWRETGGPLVRAPARRGLGTTLLGRALSGPIGGETRLDWRPQGLICELVLPASALEAPTDVPGGF
ncbi:PAS domain-containing protein [Phenylobacterium sp. LjRoot219]|uniref:HWE histidine kinase domain-containing protein n=1 Tax=Phenylobacterium sp. LjRoot219 TaxID=3342283 RepID=UPI003ECF69AB